MNKPCVMALAAWLMSGAGHMAAAQSPPSRPEPNRPAEMQPEIQTSPAPAPRPTMGVREAVDPTTPDPNRPAGPFATTRLMQQESLRNAPLVGSAALPMMSLRGLADDGKSAPLAAIEVDGGLYYIRQGQSSNVLTRGGHARMLTLEKLVDSAAAVRLEGLEQSILVR